MSHSYSFRVTLPKRIFDMCFSMLALILTSPLFLLAAVGIRIASPGPVFFRARRVGQHGHPFTMPKFRTMHTAETPGTPITAPGDSRVFPFGAFLRKTKIDELPQFWAVLVGEMSVVGPRPEDPDIVDSQYSDWMKETLRVKPGITSPGTLFAYSYESTFLDPAAPYESYVKDLLPRKLALERVYVERMGFAYDMALILRTLLTILRILAGRRPSTLPPEAAAAGRWLDAGMSLDTPGRSKGHGEQAL